MESEIQKFYHGKIVLITGASGFIGKVLLWKLLYSCPTIDTIYILMRPKRGQDVQKRVEDLLKVPIFDNFRNDNPKIFEKVMAVAGDVSIDELGISENDKQKLINDVSVVVHIAAVLNMDAQLNIAINMNTKGTLRLLKLCSEMKKLLAFVHTSTAYCYVDKEITEEAVFPSKQDPYDVMQFAELINDWFNSNVVNSVTSELINPHPNTYTFTKRLAEKIVSDYFPRLPVAIARPSIVIPSIKEPLPGWVDSLNGPVGLMVAGGKGVLRSMLCDGNTEANVVAVDIVANNLLAIGWSVATNKSKIEAIPVYNVTTIESEPLYWKEVIDYGMKAVEKYPFEKCLWYPGSKMNNNKLVHYTIAILFQWIPAYFLDLIMILIGQPRFLVHLQDKLYRGTLVLQYFTTREWKFKTDSIVKLKQSMSSTDQELFPISMKDFKDRSAFNENAIKIVRHYILKDDPASIPRCKIKMTIFYAIDCFARFFAIFLMMWFAFRFYAYLDSAINMVA